MTVLFYYSLISGPYFFAINSRRTRPGFIIYLKTFYKRGEKAHAYEDYS